MFRGRQYPPVRVMTESIGLKTQRLICLFKAETPITEMILPLDPPRAADLAPGDSGRGGRGGGGRGRWRCGVHTRAQPRRSCRRRSVTRLLSRCWSGQQGQASRRPAVSAGPGTQDQGRGRGGARSRRPSQTSRNVPAHGARAEPRAGRRPEPIGVQRAFPGALYRWIFVPVANLWPKNLEKQRDMYSQSTESGFKV